MKFPLFQVSTDNRTWMPEGRTVHANCGGTIAREISGASIRWSCDRCRAAGEFEIGVDYVKKYESEDWV